MTVTRLQQVIPSTAQTVSIMVTGTRKNSKMRWSEIPQLKDNRLFKEYNWLLTHRWTYFAPKICSSLRICEAFWHISHIKNQHTFMRITTRHPCHKLGEKVSVVSEDRNWLLSSSWTDTGNWPWNRAWFSQFELSQERKQIFAKRKHIYLETLHDCGIQISAQCCALSINVNEG